MANDFSVHHSELTSGAAELSLDPPMNSVRVGVPEIEDAL